MLVGVEWGRSFLSVERVAPACGAAGFQVRSHLELDWEQPRSTGRTLSRWVPAPKGRTDSQRGQIPLSNWHRDLLKLLSQSGH